MAPPREDLEREILRLFKLAQTQGQLPSAEHLLNALEALAPAPPGLKPVDPDSAVAEAYRDIAAPGGKAIFRDKRH